MEVAYVELGNQISVSLRLLLLVEAGRLIVEIVSCL